MRRLLLTVPLAIALAACGGGGARPVPTTADHVAELKSPDAATRRRGADALNEHAMVPPESVPALVDAYKAEHDPAARGAMIIALGVSGAPEAGPLVEDYVQKAADKDARRWGSRALRWYQIKTGKLTQDTKLPPGWPYGQPGYPDKLPETK